MSEKIAVSNNNFEIEITPALSPSPAIATPNNGTATPASPAAFGVNDCKVIEDNNCKVQNDKILVDKIENKSVIPAQGAQIDFSCAPLSVSPFTFVPDGSYVIPATALKVKCSSIKVMREGDITLIPCICGGLDSTTPVKVAFTGSCMIKISKAGQDVTEGE
ncbi:hypothetical protein DRQ25_07835 [Candidatus Fermentibacteria bacterium]|nr:MAG: hypothetical protein DRQ25_07835 [Candidatus Fermentibacteria bacterium]